MIYKLLVLLFMVPLFADGQGINSTEVKGPSNIYNDAIKRYIENLRKEKIIKTDTLYIDGNHTVIEDKLITKVGTTFVKVLSENELSGHLDNGRTLIIHYLFPLSFENGNFFIAILPLRAKKEKNENRLVNSGVLRANYSYDVKNRQFKFQKIESFGI